MFKFIILFLISLTLNAQSFTQKSILGTWEVSSLKLNGFTSFGNEFSKNRGEIYTLIFNKSGFVKNTTTGSIYNYEVTNKKLKIYQTKTYKNNHQVKDKRHFDIWSITGNFENCNLAKISKKKISGYYRKEGYKWCKVQEYPTPIVNSGNYNFR